MPDTRVISPTQDWVGGKKPSSFLKQSSLLKQSFKDSKKVKKITEKLCIKLQSLSVFLDITKVADSR